MLEGAPGNLLEEALQRKREVVAFGRLEINGNLFNRLSS